MHVTIPECLLRSPTIEASLSLRAIRRVMMRVSSGRHRPEPLPITCIGATRSSDWERDQIVGNTTHFVSTMLRLMISSSESRRSVLTVTRASLAPMSLPTGYSATFGQLRTLPIARDLALVFDARPERRDQFIELFGQFREGAVQFLTKPFRERDSAVSLQHDRAAREQQNNRRKSTN